MEQGGISIIPTTTITDTSGGKPKSIGITVGPTSSIQAAKKKFKIKWLNNLVKEDATGWETLMYGLGEVIGTAILVFIGCTGCIGSLGVVPNVLQIALTFGFAVMIAIQCTGHISGAHINPSITIASLMLGKLSLTMSLFYIVCQCVGAMLGYGFLKLITPAALIYATDAAQTSTFCVSMIHKNLTILQAFAAELIGTIILVLFACGLWDCRNSRNTDSASVRFGFCIAALCFVLIPYTGCSLNPARTLGPAVWNNYWTYHWIYWVAPITGSVMASVFYRYLFECKGVKDYVVNT